MHIYLAASFSRRAEMLGHLWELEELGHEVTSRWVKGAHGEESDVVRYPDEELRRFAHEDYEDVLDADCVVSFTETPGSARNRGGRHVEFGVAYAAGGKRMILVGPRENVFHYLDGLEVYPTWDALLAQLESERSLVTGG